MNTSLLWIWLACFLSILQTDLFLQPSLTLEQSLVHRTETVVADQGARPRDTINHGSTTADGTAALSASSPLTRGAIVFCVTTGANNNEDHTIECTDTKNV